MRLEEKRDKVIALAEIMIDAAMHIENIFINEIPKEMQAEFKNIVETDPRMIDYKKQMEKWDI